MLPRYVLIAVAVAGLAAAAGAYRGTTMPAEAPHRATAQALANPHATDASKMIARSVTNADGQTIGKIESIYIDAEGKVDGVIVSIGGLLEAGERYAMLAWKDLQISDNGKKIVVNLSKEQLKALPAAPK